MPRTSIIDTKKWVCKLKKRGIIQFKYKELPEDLKIMKFLLTAKEEEFIVRINKNGDKGSTWKITDELKCKDNDGIS